MKTFVLPHTDLTVPAVIAGMMRIRDLSDDQIRKLVDAALEQGINYFDHADVYGGSPHACEQRFAQALQLNGTSRESVVLQTKCGIVRNPRGVYYDFSSEHIVESVEGSLRALRTDYIDVLLLHRPDTLVEPEEVARAFDQLEAAGKVRYFGVSNHTPGQIELLKTAVAQPLVIDQVQLSITHSPIIAQGLAANMSGQQQSSSLDLGLLDYARTQGVTLQAWSPFQRGDAYGVFLGNPQNAILNGVLFRLAKEYDVTPMGVATAWITRHPAHMQVVLGTTRPDRVREVAKGADLDLTRAEWYELFETAGHIVP